MNEVMRRMIGRAVVAGMAGMLAGGCATFGRERRPDATDEIGGVKASLREVAHLNIAVAVTGKSPVAERVRLRIEDGLAEKAFALNRRDPDVDVNVAVNYTLFDRSGNYFVFEGTANALVTRPHDGQVLGREVINARGDRRLGEDLALQSLGDKMGAAAAEWTVRTVTSGIGDFAAADIVISRPWRLFPGSDAARYAQRFIEVVSTIPGIKWCRLVRQDLGSRELVFRILYIRRDVPEGILNRLANYRELGIEPR